jgi:septal ring factor EnvC (AmiA/AmiB activator)
MHIVGMQGKIKSQEHEIAVLKDRLRAERQININLTDKLQGTLETSERLKKHLIEKTEETNRLKTLVEHMRRSIRGIY